MSEVKIEMACVTSTEIICHQAAILADSARTMGELYRQREQLEKEIDELAAENIRLKHELSLEKSLPVEPKTE